jgi:hypothetical protein
MELPNRKIDGKYCFADDADNIIREATAEEAAAMDKQLVIDAQEDKTRPLTESEVYKLLINEQINTLTADNNTALRMMAYYPVWTANTNYTIGYKVSCNNSLYSCLQAHTSVEGWQPANAASLWEQVNYSFSGSLNEPIPYNGNMRLENGKHYLEGAAIYLCTRDTGNPVYNPLSELVGIYVEVV